MDRIGGVGWSALCADGDGATSEGHLCAGYGGRSRWGDRDLPADPAIDAAAAGRGSDGADAAGASPQSKGRHGCGGQGVSKAGPRLPGVSWLDRNAGAAYGGGDAPEASEPRDGD